MGRCEFSARSIRKDRPFAMCVCFIHRGVSSPVTNSTSTSGWESVLVRSSRLLLPPRSTAATAGVPRRGRDSRWRAGQLSSGSRRRPSSSTVPASTCKPRSPWRKERCSSAGMSSAWVGQRSPSVLPPANARMGSDLSCGASAVSRASALCWRERRSGRRIRARWSFCLRDHGCSRADRPRARSLDLAPMSRERASLCDETRERWRFLLPIPRPEREPRP